MARQWEQDPAYSKAVIEVGPEGWRNVALARSDDDARLIAAAPAMLEALHAAKDYIEREGTGVTEEAGVLGLIDGALDIVAGRDG